MWPQRKPDCLAGSFQRSWLRNLGKEQQVRGLDSAVITRSLERIPDHSFDLESDLGAEIYSSMLQIPAFKISLPWLTLTTGPKLFFIIPTGPMQKIIFLRKNN